MNASIHAVAKRYRYTGKERDEESGLYYHGARYYIPWLARWVSTEPLNSLWYNSQNIDYEKIESREDLNNALQAKYPTLSSYNYCANNPVKYIDPEGTDWFVNSKTGGVVFVKEANQMTDKWVKKIGLEGQASDYTRLGDNNMFGDKVMHGKNNILDYNYFRVDNSMSFMADKGYYQAEKVRVKETWIRESGGVLPLDNISTVRTEIQLERREGLTYIQRKDFNTKKTHIDETTRYRFSMVNEFVYTLFKIESQDYRATARWTENRVGEVNNIGTFIEAVRKINEFKLNDIEANLALKKHLQEQAAKKALAASKAKSIKPSNLQKTKNMINRMLKAGSKAKKR